MGGEHEGARERNLSRKIPSTRAVIFLRENSIDFNPHFYKYDKDAVTEAAAKEIGVETNDVVKTLVMEDDEGKPFVVLMHGDKRVSTRSLARTLGAKNVTASDPRTAERLTGYIVGGISPFGTRRPIDVYVEESILSLPRIYINGGRRGFLVEISPEDLIRALKPIVVNVAQL